VIRRCTLARQTSAGPSSRSECRVLHEGTLIRPRETLGLPLFIVVLTDGVYVPFYISFLGLMDRDRVVIAERVLDGGLDLDLLGVGGRVGVADRERVRVGVADRVRVRLRVRVGVLDRVRGGMLRVALGLGEAV
jgi:hypothetical protein